MFFFATKLESWRSWSTFFLPNTMAWMGKGGGYKSFLLRFGALVHCKLASAGTPGYPRGVWLLSDSKRL